MSSNKRASVVPAGPKPPTTIAPSAIIHDHASLTGTFPITIGPNTVLHPRAKILSTHGPVTIGQGCIICERSSIGLSSTPETSGPANAGVTIEDRVNVEVGAVVEARRVGMGCVIEVKACVGKDAVLGKHCNIGPLCEVGDGETLPEFTVVYGEGQRRIDRSGHEERRVATYEKHIEVLRKLIPSSLAKWQTGT